MHPKPIGASETFVSAYWDQLSDVELLNVPWVVDDPRTLPNIQSVKPDIMGGFQIETEYARDLSEEPMRCVHCPRHQRHWKGFVLKDDQDNRYLLGSKCGPDAYGADYRLANEARNRARRRYNALVALEEATRQLPDFIEALQEAAASPSTRTLRVTRREFETHAPKTLEVLRRVRSSGPTDQLMLSAIGRRRDAVAEAARDAEYQVERLKLASLTSRKHREAVHALDIRLNPHQPIYRNEDLQIGPLEGAAWLLRQDNPANQLRDVVARLRGYAALAAAKTKDTPVGRLGHLSRAIAQDLDLAHSTLVVLRDARRFFEPANLNRIAQWAPHALEPTGSITTQGSTLFVADSGGRRLSLTLGATWRPPGDLFLSLRT